MNEEKTLLYAAVIKLITNEPMSLNDLNRIIGLIQNAAFAIQGASSDEVAAAQSQLITMLQQKFMQGQTQA